MIRAWVLAAVLLGVVPVTADAQLFLASRPHPEFEIGPLTVRARLTPSLNPVTVDVFFSLVIPAKRTAGELQQDIFLLWPGGVSATLAKSATDPSLVRYVEERGMTVLATGRLPLLVQSLYQRSSDASREPVAHAPFVTFSRDASPLGESAPATYVRIPWVAAMVNRAAIVDLRLTMPRFVTQKKAPWIEDAFWGPRHVATLSFNDIRGRGLFPLYFENRDRLIHLSEDPSQIVINFADADHLKVNEVSPPTANRRPSQGRVGSENISLYLDRSEGLKPQMLTVQFGYFSGMRSWMPILIPIAFFALGNLAGPLLKAVAERAGRAITARVHIARGDESEAARETGVILSRETLARIVPGETTRDEVMKICGPDAEEFEQIGAADRRTLVYRGRRVLPRRQRTFGWVATVSHWDVEHHEVEIELEHDRVHDVHARVRRARLAHPTTA